MGDAPPREWGLAGGPVSAIPVHVQLQTLVQHLHVFESGLQLEVTMRHPKRSRKAGEISKHDGSKKTPKELRSDIGSAMLEAFQRLFDVVDHLYLLDVRTGTIERSAGR